jgi:hypothetical protein
MNETPAKEEGSIEMRFHDLHIGPAADGIHFVIERARTPFPFNEQTPPPGPRPAGDPQPARKYLNARAVYAQNYGPISRDDFEELGFRGDPKYAECTEAFNRAHLEWKAATAAWQEKNPELHAWMKSVKVEKKRLTRGVLE